MIRSSLFIGLFLSALTLLPLTVQAQSASILNLSNADFTDLSKEFSGNFMHHSVQGAASLGDIFGFEVGLVGGQQASPILDRISKANGGSGVSNLYHAGLLGVLSVPLGFTGEIMMIPKTSSNDIDLQMTSLALKLSLNSELLKVIPFNLALRAFSSSSKVSFTQTIPAVGSASVDSETTVTGFQVLASPSLPIVEPYAGVGFLSGKNSLGSTAGSIFADGSTSKSETNGSTQFLLGVNANLLFFHLGAEYSNAFGTSAYTAKLAFGF
jgi:hypothetical protein